MDLALRGDRVLITGGSRDPDALFWG